MFRPATAKPTTQKPSEGNGQWTPDPNPGQWEWKPPTTTTTETSFIETSNVAEPLSGDYKVVCCKLFFFIKNSYYLNVKVMSKQDTVLIYFFQDF